jgi:hypothetical protein
VILKILSTDGNKYPLVIQTSFLILYALSSYLYVS